MWKATICDLSFNKSKNEKEKICYRKMLNSEVRRHKTAKVLYIYVFHHYEQNKFLHPPLEIVFFYVQNNKNKI